MPQSRRQRCLPARRPGPWWDVLLAQKIGLETMERGALAVAISQPVCVYPVLPLRRRERAAHSRARCGIIFADEIHRLVSGPLAIIRTASPAVTSAPPLLRRRTRSNCTGAFPASPRRATSSQRLEERQFVIPSASPLALPPQSAVACGAAATS
jgi:hypothetical protein